MTGRKSWLQGPGWKVWPACLQHPALAVLLGSETCPRYLARIWCVLGCGILCVTAMEVWQRALEGLGWRVGLRPSSAPAGWWGPCVASHLWGHFHPRGWRIRNWRAFYFLNNTISGALCWGLQQKKNPKWFLELLCVSLCASRKPDLNVPENTCTPYALTSFVLAQCVINHFKIPSSQCLLPWRGVYCAELHQFRRIRLNIDTLCSHQVGVLEQTTIKIFMLPC